MWWDKWTSHLGSLKIKEFFWCKNKRIFFLVYESRFGRTYKNVFVFFFWICSLSLLPTPATTSPSLSLLLMCYSITDVSLTNRSRFCIDMNHHLRCGLTPNLHPFFLRSSLKPPDPHLPKIRDRDLKSFPIRFSFKLSTISSDFKSDMSLSIRYFSGDVFRWFTLTSAFIQHDRKCVRSLLASISCGIQEFSFRNIIWDFEEIRSGSYYSLVMFWTCSNSCIFVSFGLQWLAAIIMICYIFFPLFTFRLTLIYLDE